MVESNPDDVSTNQAEMPAPETVAEPAHAGPRHVVRDAIWSLLAGLAVGATPLTTNRLIPSLAIGGLAAGGTWVALRRNAGESGQEQAGGAQALTTPVLLGLLALGAMWIVTFLPTFEFLRVAWTSSLWNNSHGVFIPPFVAYLAARELSRDPHRQREEPGSLWGLPLLVLGVGMAVYDLGIQTHYLGVIGMLLTLPGLALLLLGVRRLRLLAIPLALSLLMVPIPVTAVTHLYLRHATADAVGWILRVSGIRALQEETVIHMPGNVFVVADECSGFSTQYATLTVALILVLLTRGIWRKVAILAAAPLLAYAANVVRVLALILLTSQFGDWVLDSPIHPASGVATFVISMGGLFLIAGRQGPAKKEGST